MQNKLTKTDFVLPSRSNYNAELSLPDSIDIFMDMAMEHAELLGLGITAFSPQNLFWVAAKTKVHFNRRIKMAEKISFHTWPQTPGKAKANRQYLVTKDDEILAYGKTEWVVINTESKAIQKMEKIYSPDFVFDDTPGDEEDFERIRDFKDGTPMGEYTVRCIDIDYGLHMNNVAYVRTIVGLFTMEEWDRRHFSDFQIDYRVSCYEGDKLLLTGKEENGALYIRGALEDGSTIFLAKLS
ncbi:MAG: hypothetical protein IJH82_04950 [Lachnospiraceae bacterium]|nr:hypothetical protein [Lachnospiraceae bacterium]